jgi:hypothetical protein
MDDRNIIHIKPYMDNFSSIRVVVKIYGEVCLDAMLEDLDYNHWINDEDVDEYA